MGEEVLTKKRIFWGGYDLSGQANSISLSYSAEMRDRTSFRSSARQRIAGLLDTEFTLSGYWHSTQADKQIQSDIGSTGNVLSVIASGTSQGSRVFMVQHISGEYSPSGAIGDIFSFDFAGYAKQGLIVRGKAIEISTALSTGNGNAIGLGVTPTSTQKLAVAHHVLSPTSSPSLSKVHVEVSSSSGFGTASTMFTLTAVTGASTVKSQWATTSASTVPNFVRCVVTSSSGTPTYNAVICAGVY